VSWLQAEPKSGIQFGSEATLLVHVFYIFFQICRIRALLGVGSVSACAFVCLRHCPKGLQYELAKSWLSDVWERIVREHVEQRSDEM